MNWFKKVFFIENLMPLLLLIIVSFMLVSDLFFMPAQPQTFDEWTHLLTINGFYNSFAQQSFPISWVDSVANYGSPLGQISHQITSYTALIFFVITHNLIFSYNFTALLGSISATILMYYFLRLHFTQLSSLAAAVLFTFAPYRISNLYIRGALPEFFASAFIPLLLIGIHQLFFNKSIKGLILIFISSLLLALSHPMMVIIGFSLAGFYLLYAIFALQTKKQKAKYIFLFCATAFLGIIVASYYIVPLILELKYFHYGTIAQSKENYYFLHADNFLVEKWNYYNFETVGIRENRLQMGGIELAILIIGIVITIYKKITNQKFSNLLVVWFIGALAYIFLMTSGSKPLYDHIPLLSGVQYPWRFLTALIFIPPLFLAYSIDQIKLKSVAFVGVVVIIALIRFPQLYGKNYIDFPDSRYEFSKVNPHGNYMLTVWAEESYKYPVKENKLEIIDGSGKIIDPVTTPTSHSYSVQADTNVRIADYTFYFPGWTLMVDANPAEIIYQDPNYRGIITYYLPAGMHTIELVYKDTKIRMLGKVVTVVSVVFVFAITTYYLQLNKKKKTALNKILFD